MFHRESLIFLGSSKAVLLCVLCLLYLTRCGLAQAEYTLRALKWVLVHESKYFLKVHLLAHTAKRLHY